MIGKDKERTAMTGVAVAALLLLAMPPALAGSLCGNLRLDPGETCDDGNSAFGDGCSAVCTVESGYRCTAPWTPLIENVVEDSGFEQGPGNPFWGEGSVTFETPICDIQSCPGGPGSRQGAFWGRFASSFDFEQAFVRQIVTIPPGFNVLRFDLQMPMCDSAEDELRVTVDETTVFEVRGDDPRCFAKAYSSQTVWLDTAPGGPWDDGGEHELRFIGTLFPPFNQGSNFAVDNVVIGRPAGPTNPSVCSLTGTTLAVEDFDPPTGGDLASIGFIQVLVGELELPWGTTDDGFCGSGDVPPGNFTGSAGEAACIDSNAAGPGIIESYLCAGPFDLGDSLGTLLSLFVNYQPPFPPGPSDFFSVLVADLPPEPGTIGDFIPVFETDQPLGDFAEPNGVQLDLDLVQFDGLHEFHFCLGFGGDGSFYAQADMIVLSSEGCINDFDADKLESCIDNCETKFNPLQLDTDNDGYGNACDADIARPGVSLRVPIIGNGNDCLVNFADLAAMKQAFLSNPLRDNWNPDADLNGDGLVNFADLAAMKEQFLGLPGPSGVTSVCGISGGT